MDKTVSKALRVIEALAHAGPDGHGVSELSRELDLTKSNVHRLLNTLVSHDYVRRHLNGGYTLTLKLWRLGHSVLDQFDLIGTVRPFLQELRDKTGETARLSVFVDDNVVLLDQVNSLHPVSIQARTGALLPPTCAATGKALLAHQSDDVVERIAKGIVRYTPNTITSQSKLRTELAQIRERGIAINRGEYRETVRAIAAPLRAAGGDVIAAIGISGPAERLNENAMEKFVPIVKAVSEAASEVLGHLKRSNLESRPSRQMMRKTGPT